MNMSEKVKKNHRLFIYLILIFGMDVCKCNQYTSWGNNPLDN